MLQSPVKPEPIPVVDLFAGPGGLGDGFAAYCASKHSPAFELVAAAEKDEGAWHTLLVRSLYRRCNRSDAAKAQYLAMIDALELASKSGSPLEKQKKVLAEYETKLQSEFLEAKSELLHGTIELGKRKDNGRLEARLNELNLAQKSWVLVGGPPCQAFSIVGRSRNSGNANYDPFQDKRIGLYREYIRILRKFAPSIFVMENVMGLATAKLGNELVVARMFRDLTRRFTLDGKKLGYDLFALSDGQPVKVRSSEDFSQTCRQFLLKAENYGVPQTRHRVIFVGVRNDLEVKEVPALSKSAQVPVTEALSGLPKLTAHVSKRSTNKKLPRQSILSDCAQSLLESLDEIGKKAPDGFSISSFSEVVTKQIRISTRYQSEDQQAHAREPNAQGKKAKEASLKPKPRIYNHDPRTHMAGDLQRYFFCACWAKAYGKSPKAVNFPQFLVPEHESFSTGAFSDRFRVQIPQDCAKTVTSHISKDGHYFIHPDPAQCRSLTVREAARLQTFADDHFFMSSRTSQFQQVGNAVPPKLAVQIAQSVYECLGKYLKQETATETLTTT